MELKRLKFIQTEKRPQQEKVQRGPYIDDDVEFILISIHFGDNLTEDEFKEIKKVVNASSHCRIQSR
jgi:hypothetical protein